MFSRSIQLTLSLILLAATGFTFGSEGEPAKDSKIEFFEKRIRPVLVKHCYECHSRDAKKVRGGLLLDTRRDAQRGGESGPAVVPGKVEKSLLISAIRYDDFEMPPKQRLSDQIVADFVRWIEIGAPDPRDGEASVVTNKKIDMEEARKFWAFRPPKQHTPTVIDDDWSRTDIDRFVYARLRESDLTPVSDASPRTLIRRLTFDLTGLPPTPREIENFLQESIRNPNLAIRNLVDRLLSSRHFGEHWGRHWLDVSRYADSNGGDINLTFHNAWRFRDYVIQSFNDDKPFDLFIVEQLAGDLLRYENDPQRAEQMIASGFLIVGPKMLSERSKEKLHMDVVDEQLDTIGRTFLGMTIGCARCHDHKFDPIPTRDYYALAGILRSTVTVQGIRMNNVNVSGWIERELPVSPEHKEALSAHNLKFKSLNKQLAEAKKSLEGVKKNTAVAVTDLLGIVVDDTDAKLVGAWKKSTHVPRYVGAGYVHDNKEDKGNKSITYTPKLPHAGEYEVRISFASGNGRDKKVPVEIRHADGEQTIHIDQFKTPSINRLFYPLGRFRFEAGDSGSVTIRTEGTVEYVIADAAQFIPFELLKEQKDAVVKVHSQELAERQKQVVLLEQQLAKLKKNAPPPIPMAMSANDRPEPADCEIRIRGEPNNRGEKVRRGYLTVIDSFRETEVDPSQSGRLQLARWIASPQNPLTARVIVNRCWHHLFGSGIVPSVDNFGRLGQRPSHLKLLDRLAIDFMNDGWSVKKLLRRIVLSRVYQLSAQHDDRAMKIDPQNRLLWRHNRRRLPGESLRDAILVASGSVDRAPGGSSVAHLGDQAIANNLRDKTGYVSIDDNVRRSVYLPLVRNNLPEILTVFNFADPDVVVGARSVTTVPAQALLMMNSNFVKRHARSLAELVLADDDLDEGERLHSVYQRTLGRPPTNKESKQALSYIADLEGNETEKWADFCHVLLASTEFRFID